MSDIIDEDRPNKKGKPNNGDGVKAVPVAVDPVASNPELFEWLEELFYGDAENYPERVEIFSTVLRSNRINKIKKIRQYPFAPRVATEEVLKAMPGMLGKPTKTALVSLSNRTMTEIQRDCDAFRKPQTYTVYAINTVRGSEPYAEFSLYATPKSRYKEDDAEHEDDEEKQSAQAQMFAQILQHQKEMVGMLAVAFEGVVDRDDRTIKRLMDRNENLENRLDGKHDQLERALSLEAEREAKRVKDKMWSEATQKGLDMALQLGPPIITSLVGKGGGGAAISGADGKPLPTLEGATLKNFFLALSPEQQNGLVGEWDETGENLITPGILTAAQAKLLFMDVANGRVSVDELDKVLEGGEHEVTQDQLMAIAQLIPMQMLVSLKVLIDSRTARRAAPQK